MPMQTKRGMSAGKIRRNGPWRNLFGAYEKDGRVRPQKPRATRPQKTTTKTNYRPRKKLYAVKYPEPKSIYTSWDDCKRRVYGLSRVVFRGFYTRAEAESWLACDAAGIAEEPTDQLRIYVDGSYMHSISTRAGWAFVVVSADDKEEIARGSGVTDEVASSRNIDGELTAVLRAMAWCISNGRERPLIVHDYIGIAEWAKGNWKAESTTAKCYVDSLRAAGFAMDFESVAGHSGNKWNDIADELAKDAIRQHVG